MAAHSVSGIRHEISLRRFAGSVLPSTPFCPAHGELSQLAWALEILALNEAGTNCQNFSGMPPRNRSYKPPVHAV